MLPIDQNQQNNNYYTNSNTSSTSMTNHLQDTNDKLDNISEKNISHRQITNTAVTFVADFKQSYPFNNTREMLSCFLSEITMIYQEIGIQQLPEKILSFILYSSKLKFTGYHRNFDNALELYNFLCKLKAFIASAIKILRTEIEDIIEFFFYKCTINSSMKKDRILFLQQLSYEQISEVATSKNLYIYIKKKTWSTNISYDKLQEFLVQRNNSNQRKTFKIYQSIVSCNTYSRKILVKEYIDKILPIFTNKDLDIDDKFLEVIKVLIRSVEIPDADIKDIFEKMIIYFQAIDDENWYVDTSMFTKNLFNKNGEIKSKLLFSIYDVIGNQLQSMSTSKCLYAIKTNEAIKYFNQDTDLSIKDVDTINQQPQETELLAQACSTSTTINTNDLIDINTITTIDNIALDCTNSEINSCLVDNNSNLAFLSSDKLELRLVDDFTVYNKTSDNDNGSKSLDYDVGNQTEIFEKSEYDLANIADEIADIKPEFNIKDSSFDLT